MIARTRRETVMLEALERITKRTRHADSTAALRYPDVACAPDCAACFAEDAIATVKAMDEAELRGGAEEVGASG
ncbi:MAG: hypothetical protein EPN98_21280 [Phenylobacterium sp.]|uniref:hypothetical protein n=1 Tax=Phenylobacterium sp. TaxID=1871053 RepID=UPI0012295A12|nr:hypothetical protein [Phenylobacterium sp.]TAL28977.1 MAG: hypothetical protein EPN98_21280 [Phenylobacterium sp.]